MRQCRGCPGAPMSSLVSLFAMPTGTSANFGKQQELLFQLSQFGLRKAVCQTECNRLPQTRTVPVWQIAAGIPLRNANVPLGSGNADVPVGLLPKASRKAEGKVSASNGCSARREMASSISTAFMKMLPQASGRSGRGSKSHPMRASDNGRVTSCTHSRTTRTMTAA